MKILKFYLLLQPPKYLKNETNYTWKFQPLNTFILNCHPQEKGNTINLKLPFLKDEKLSEEEKNDLESKFWLMVLRAGGMDPEKGFEVLMNFIRITNNYPDYFAASKPPTKLDCVFQQKVFFT